MRHHNTNRKFGRTRDQRRALLRSLLSALVVHEAITTTEARAKEIRPTMEKLVTKAQKNTLATRRLLQTRLAGDTEAAKLINEIAPRYANRPGGYTRITKLPRRQSDGSPMARIEFV